jgi:sigma-B regulation protein RsbU (phosphoserine phosphatase)
VPNVGRQTAASTARDYGDWNIEEQLRLAAEVQTALLPKPLLDTGRLSIRTLYLPADYVSGDLYEIARLDETRIGISLADVTGHGLPAAMLTFLVRQSLRGKEILDHSYRILEPDEVLGRLNDDLLNARLHPCRLITALHAVCDRTSGRIRWARGGCPYPILLRPGRPAELLRSDGGLIGAFPQPFETSTLQLEPGGALIFHTDGVDALLLDGQQVAASDILHTDWIRLLQNEGVTPALQALRDLAAHSAHDDWPADDITVITLQMG